MTDMQLNRRALILGAAALALPSSAAAAPRVATAYIETMTNAERRRHGRPEFQRSLRLSRAAQNYSAVLARRNELSHSVDGTTLSYRAKSVGYSYSRLAENIGWVERRGGIEDIAGWFIEGWMLSPGHRRNILDSKLHQIGVGMTQVGRRYYAVQVFGARL